ncbi:UvrD-helicase domain-containing protein [Corticimicrobacter populi]|uniref:DNA 3'-5' helicase n=1 Tax=Corticimicrobacter populi TaxID=2175229 RepID=A0A2V1K3X1_9BURK|nr:UvrD-helicase domain-containing protein [Corticimicrobacter populi]PWF25280.1 DNA helicase II [Corticimicrobacter populi]
MIESLNPQQRAAVTLEPRHALVLAGAGSGKTRVLTTRMAWLIQTGQVTPYGLMAVTFTNKAAREMLTRVAAILPIDTRGLWVGTFHGLCNRMLRAHHRDAGLPQTFQILDSADQLSAIKRLLKGAGIDDDKYPPRDVQRFINNAKESGLRPAQVEVWDNFSRKQVEIYELYEAQCQREGVVDFAELLLRAYELLSRNAPIREHYQRRFRHILVDEFQDTNALQYKWLTLLAGGGAALFAVGDDDQSIYAFRGANVGNMADFERDYAQGNVIRLEQNYRSYGHILDAANALIEHNDGRMGKNLWTDQGAGEPVRIMEQPSDLLEAQWVLDEIRSLVADGCPRHEIAILYRSNAQSRVIEHQLFTAGIPYRVYGGLRFFERQEIKHALAYMRLLANPGDDTAWLRVVNFPARGIGARTLESQADAARTHGVSLADAVPFVAGRGGSSLAQFATLIAQMREDTRRLSLPELVDHVIAASGLRAFYQGEREGAERLENLSELINAAAAFAGESGYEGLPAGELPPSAPFAPLDAPALATDEVAGAADVNVMTPLSAFLSHASLEAGDNQAQAGQDAVQMMTVHAAKGLEFKAVFVTGLEEGLFPHENSLLEQSGLEEERRLMYVAMTRARERLYLSLAQSRMLHGQTRYAMRSRFLEEVPEEHVKWLTPRVRESRSWDGGAASSGWNAPRDAFGRPDSGTTSPRGGRVGGASVTVGDQQFRIGQGVRHARFGEGTIIGLSGQGQDAQAQIQFQDVGAKTLALGIAKLDVVA